MRSAAEIAVATKLTLRSHAELASIPFTSLLKAQKQLNKGKQKGKGKERATEDEEDVRRSGKKGGKGGKGKMREDDHHRSNKHA